MPPPATHNEPDRIDALRIEFRDSMHKLREAMQAQYAQQNQQHTENVATLARQDEALERIEVKVNKTDHLLVGNGDGSGGLVARLNRVHDAYESFKRLFWVVLTSVIGIIVLAAGSVAFYRLTGHWLSQ